MAAIAIKTPLKCHAKRRRDLVLCPLKQAEEGSISTGATISVSRGTGLSPPLASPLVAGCLPTTTNLTRLSEGLNLELDYFGTGFHRWWFGWRNDLIFAS